MGSNAFEKVDSEIALTAFLAATITGYEMSSNGYYPVFKVIAIGLLVLTLLRRMAIMQRLHAKSNPLKVTTYVLDFATYAAILYCIQIPLRWINSAFELPISLPLFFGIVAPVLLFSSFLGWEIAYASALDEGSRIFGSAAQKHRGTVLGAVFRSFADSLSEDNQSKLSEYQQETKPEDLPLEDLVRIGLDFLLTTAIGITVLITYIIAVWSSGFLFNEGWPSRLLLFIATLVTGAIVRMWYSQYGIVKAEDRHGVLVFFGEIGAFLLVGASLFPH